MSSLGTIHQQRGTLLYLLLFSGDAQGCDTWSHGGGGRCGLSLTNMAVCVALTNWSSDAESGCVKSCIWYLKWQELLNYSVPVSNFMFIYTTCWNVLIYTPDQDEQENNLSMLHEAGCRRNSCLLHFSSNLLTNYWMEVCADAFCLLFHCQ